MDIPKVTRRVNLVKHVRKVASRTTNADDAHIILQAAEEIERLWDVVLTYSEQYERGDPFC